MSRPSTLPTRWLALAGKLGGVAALAEACSVDVKTVWRWANGENTPSAVARRYVDDLAREHGLARPWGGA